jgi:hypothetical protein
MPRPPADAAEVDTAPVVVDAGDDAIGLGCSLSPQSGCPAEAPACDLDVDNLATGGTECRDVYANGRETNTCVYLDDCDVGYGCIGDGTANSCLAYCDTSADCTAPGGACEVTLVAMGAEIPGVRLCTQNCDYLVHGGCPGGWGCHLYRTMAGVQYSGCYPAGAGGQDAACTTDRDCALGFSCYSVTSGGTTSQVCLQHCRISAPASSCTTGTCTGGTMPITMGGVTYGACL